MSDDAEPRIPRNDEGRPVFREPWEAQAFAMALALHARGLFTWTEWAGALAAEIAAAQCRGDADEGETYYCHWLAALERLVIARGASTERELDDRRHAWERAAARTPHGQPIELCAEDFSDR